jgi:hypothetical protein
MSPFQTIIATLRQQLDLCRLATDSIKVVSASLSHFQKASRQVHQVKYNLVRDPSVNTGR